MKLRYGSSIWSNLCIIADTEENCEKAQVDIREHFYAQIDCIDINVAELMDSEIESAQIEKIVLAALSSPDFEYESMENYLYRLE